MFSGEHNVLIARGGFFFLNGQHLGKKSWTKIWTADVLVPLMWYTWSLLGCNSCFLLSASRCLSCKGMCGGVGFTSSSCTGADNTAACCGAAVGSWTSPGAILNARLVSRGAFGISGVIKFGGHGGLSNEIIKVLIGLYETYASISCMNLSPNLSYTCSPKWAYRTVTVHKSALDFISLKWHLQTNNYHWVLVRIHLSLQ